MPTLIIQSCSPVQRTSWIADCLQSVERWTQDRGHDYRFIGDEIFERVPQWYRAKVGNKLPVATDYARLVLARDALASGYDEVVWFDADLLIFDEDLRLDFDGSCAFGQEVWVEWRDGRLRARRNVHNAVCVFRAGCPVLPYLIHTITSLIRRVDPAHIAPQMAGPKLLNALHPLSDFALLPQVGALSSEVVADLAAGQGTALDMLRRETAVPLQAVNFSASVNGGELAAAAIGRLLKDGWHSPPEPAKAGLATP